MPPTRQTACGFESAAASLTRDDVERFGRQMLVEEIGAVHMEEIRHARVVCVGAGGLGSTVLLYLAAAGVGHLTIVDFDQVELSNLHRQVVHSTAAIGEAKAESAKAACLRLCPLAHIDAVVAALSPANAESLFHDCDVVVDGTDNVAARYLINDAAMRCGKPLVSGSAMGWDGQLSVYGYRGGPCYRCLFPRPPPPETVGSCNESGVVGPVPGMIGCLQALETLKVITGVGEPLRGRMYVFNGLRFASRVVTLRAQQPQCTACGLAAVASTTPLAELAALHRPEYVAGACTVLPAALPPAASCTVTEYAAQRQSTQSSSPGSVATLDVRTRVQFDMAHLSHSLSVPYQQLVQWERAGALLARLGEALRAYQTPAVTLTVDAAGASEMTVFVLCRRGVNSAKAVALIRSALEAVASDDADAGALRHITFKNVAGGLNAYHMQVDNEFPFY